MNLKLLPLSELHFQFISTHLQNNIKGIMQILHSQNDEHI